MDTSQSLHCACTPFKSLAFITASSSSDAHRVTPVLRYVNTVGRPFLLQDDFGHYDDSRPSSAWELWRARSLESQAYDPSLFIEQFERRLTPLLQSETEGRNIKVWAVLNVTLERDHNVADNNGNLDPQKVAEGHRLGWRWTGPTTMTERFDQNLYPTFNTALTIMNMQDAAAAFTDIMTGYSEQLETWLQYLRFVRGNYIDVSVAHYQPLQGAAFVQLPKYVQNKKSTINVQNKDNMCFKWALLSALHRAPHHAERVTWYKPYENDLNFTGIAFPVLKDAIEYKKFEQNNPTISLSVYCFIEEEQMDGKKVKGEITVDNFHRKLMIFYHSNLQRANHVQLLFYGGHYVWIKDWQAFTNSDGKHHHYCPRCLLSFKTTDNLAQHMKDCSSFEPMNTSLPADGAVMSFTNWNKTLRHPVCIECDFEALSVAATNPTFARHKQPMKDAKFSQVSASFGMRVVCDIELSQPPTYSYVGEHVHQEFVDSLRRYADCIRKEVFDADKEMLPLTEEEETMWQAATHCPHCKIKYGMQLQRYDKETKAMKTKVCVSG